MKIILSMLVVLALVGALSVVTVPNAEAEVAPLADDVPACKYRCLEVWQECKDLCDTIDCKEKCSKDNDKCVKNCYKKSVPLSTVEPLKTKDQCRAYCKGYCKDACEEMFAEEGAATIKECVKGCMGTCVANCVRM